MKSKATLKHISDLLQISISTVSRALKDHPDIAEQTKKKVRELAELLEYEPNSFAIQLRTNASKLIGVIVPEISGLFYHSFIAGVEEEARSWGYSLLILQSNNDPAHEMNNLRLCRFNRTAGILVAFSSYSGDLMYFERTRESGIPVVFYDKVPDSREFPKVSVADVEAGFLAADAIIRANKRNILAIFGDPEMSITRKRLKAFSGTFRKQAPDRMLRVLHASNSEDARSHVASLLGTKKDRPDLIFCMSDEILTGAMKALQALKLRIPTDISLLAISNGFIPSLFDPAITYVETSGVQLGRKSFEVLHRCISGNPPQVEVTIPARLVEGGSL
jgi:LacI family transcriptional regulator